MSETATERVGTNKVFKEGAEPCHMAKEGSMDPTSRQVTNEIISFHCSAERNLEWSCQSCRGPEADINLQ